MRRAFRSSRARRRDVRVSGAVYSNVGFETLADHIAARAEMPFADYLAAGVLQPLGLRAELRGSPAADLHGSLDDLLILARELQRPTLVAPETLAEATTVQFPVSQECCRTSAGSIRTIGASASSSATTSRPHWTGSRNSPRTFGHFGGSGTFLWVDPEAGLALGVLTNLDFGDWAKEAWPRLSDAVLLS